MAQLGKKISWDIELAGQAAGLGVKLNADNHPLVPTPGRYVEKATMNQTTLDKFLDQLNSR